MNVTAITSFCLFGMSFLAGVNDQLTNSGIAQ